MNVFCNCNVSLFFVTVDVAVMAASRWELHRSRRRIQSELKCIQHGNLTCQMPSDCYVEPLSSDDLHHWRALIIGPKDTPYEDGYFLLNITFPARYPVEPDEKKVPTAGMRSHGRLG